MLVMADCVVSVVGKQDWAVSGGTSHWASLEMVTMLIILWIIRSLRLPHWAGQQGGEVESDCETETECGAASVCVSTWSAEENEEETRVTVTDVESEGSSGAWVEFEEDTTEEGSEEEREDDRQDDIRTAEWFTALQDELGQPR